MTAGAGMFPGDDEVDQLWIEMDAAARAPERLAAGRILQPGEMSFQVHFLPILSREKLPGKNWKMPRRGTDSCHQKRLLDGDGHPVGRSRELSG